MDTVPAEYDDRVDGPLVHYFLLTIDIVVDGKTDFSVVDTVFILADILNAKKTGTKCLYKFKVCLIRLQPVHCYLHLNPSKQNPIYCRAKKEKKFENIER